MTSGPLRNSTAEAILLAIPIIDRWIGAHLSHDPEHDLSLRQLAVLQRIDAREITPGEIARELSVTPAVITGLIDRLERRGYVSRLESQADRRRVHLALTISGEDARNQAITDLVEKIGSQLENLTDQELTGAAAALETLARTLTGATPGASPTLATR